jgi:hypothetical protein
MVDGREYESMLNYRFEMGIPEMRKSIEEIKNCTETYTICLLANGVNPNIKSNTSINASDDLPFAEMINSIPTAVRKIDIILVTPGGSAEQVVRFVDKLRPRFDEVRFILPNAAMSADTIFVMSGDEIIMSKNSYIGPIDPQVINKDGRLVPAQSLLALIDDIKKRGDVALSKRLQPDWTDLQILSQIDHKDLGNAINGSNFSIELVKNYLSTYKFKSWEKHHDGTPVTIADKENAAREIAIKLCDNKLWKSHARGITREIAWNECRLRIINAESITGLERSINRFWALMYWFFENSVIYKVFLSMDYAIIRLDNSLINIKP